MTRAELIAALKAAEGPSRELDQAVYLMLRPGLYPSVVLGVLVKDPRYAKATKKYSVIVGKTVRVPPITSSIDAALALVEQVCGREPPPKALYDALDYAVTDYGDHWRTHLPRYLCIAALEAEEQQP